MRPERMSTAAKVRHVVGTLVETTEKCRHERAVIKADMCRSTGELVVVDFSGVYSCDGSYERQDSRVMVMTATSHPLLLFLQCT